MARILKEDEFNAKRSEILDMVQRLIYTKGYQQMTVQDVLDGLHISKGALYHYFTSKEAMLEALVDRMESDAERLLQPIVADPTLSAIEKFRQIFLASAKWKSSQKALLIDIIRVWYSKENIFIRQKLSEESLKKIAELYKIIVLQGVAEGSFTTPYPNQIAIIITGISLSLSDTVIELIINAQDKTQATNELELTMDACFDSIERLLGVPKGTFQVFGPEAFADWIIVPPNPGEKAEEGPIAM